MHIFASATSPRNVAECGLRAQVTVLGIPRKGGGLAVHIVLLLRLFRMWRVIKLVEVRRFGRPGQAAACRLALWACLGQALHPFSRAPLYLRQPRACMVSMQARHSRHILVHMTTVFQ